MSRPQTHPHYSADPDTAADLAGLTSIVDFVSGEPVAVTVYAAATRAAADGTEAVLYTVAVPGVSDALPVVVWPDGAVFTPDDWQRDYGPGDVPRWVDAHGRHAVVLPDGLPRGLA